MSRLVSLDQFRRKNTTPGAPGISREPERSKSWRAYEADVRATIDRLRNAALSAIEHIEDPREYKSTFGVSAVLRESRRGRTQLYTQHPQLVEEIKAAEMAIDRALAARSSQFKRETKTALKQKIRNLEEQLEAEMAKHASTQLSELIAAMRPSTDQILALRAENSALTKKAADLEAAVERQQGIIDQLLKQLASQTGKRR